MTPIDFVFTRSKVMVTRVTFVNNVKRISAYYLENYLSQSFHISHAGGSWLGHDLYQFCVH